jgi:hypothetical protein
MNKELLDWVEEPYDNLVITIEKNRTEDYTREVLTPEQFIKELILHNEFAETWSVSVNRRELTLAERKKIYEDIHIPGFQVEENVWLESKLIAHNIPKQVITLTYNNKTIETYGSYTSLSSTTR